MSSEKNPAEPRDVQLHPFLRRLAHWLQALSILIMTGSGWRIYNAVPIFNFQFPLWATLGGERLRSEPGHLDHGPANAINWHFTGMWLLLASFLLFLAHGLLSGHFRRDLWPVRPRDILRDFIAALTFRLDHRLGVYNAVQKAMYWGVLFAILMMFLTGLAIWKPVQFQFLTWLFGGFQTARLFHFLFMAAIVAFTVVHVALVIVVPKTFVAMVVGRASEPRHGHADKQPAE